MNAITEQQEIFKRNSKQSKVESETIEQELNYLKEKMDASLKERDVFIENKDILQNKLKD